MDSLDRIRAGHKKLREQPLLHPITEEQMELGAHERTLAQIMQDPEEQNNFINRFLYKQDETRAKEIAEALADGHILTEEQDAWLEEERLNFNQRRLEAEQLREFLSKEDVDRLGELDPRIEQVIGKIGAAKTGEILAKEFESLALSDDAAFERMKNLLRGMREWRGSEIKASTERDFVMQLSKYGIREEDYIKATEKGDSPDTIQELAELAKKKYSLFREAVDAVSGGALSYRAGRKLYMTYQVQRNLMEQSDSYMKAIGSTLAGTLNQNTKLAIQRAMLEGGSVEEKKEKDEVSTIEQYREAKEAADPVALKKRYTEFMEAEARRKGIKDWTKQQTLHDELTDTFVNREYSKMQNHQKARGLFALLLSFLFVDKQQIKDAIK